MSETIRNLIDKYVALGDDPTSAAWWASNPSNPESPRYDEAEAKKCEAFRRELCG